MRATGAGGRAGEHAEGGVLRSCTSSLEAPKRAASEVLDVRATGAAKEKVPVPAPEDKLDSSSSGCSS